MCAAGGRSMIAANLLKADGYSTLNVSDGFSGNDIWIWVRPITKIWYQSKCPKKINSLYEIWIKLKTFCAP